MKYIFLDIDGVLNKESSWRSKPYDVNYDCLKNFAKICNNDTRIILSSTWKKGFRKDINDCTEQIKTLRLALQEFGLDIYDVTPERNGDRELEISRYINTYDIKDYIIVDDDKSLFPNNVFKNNMLLVDCKKGFSESDVNRIKRK